MNKKCILEISDKILASTLSGNQREQIVNFIHTDPNISFQQAARFLSKKIDVSDSIIYSFLMTHDWHITRSNDFLKRK